MATPYHVIDQAPAAPPQNPHVDAVEAPQYSERYPEKGVGAEYPVGGSEQQQHEQQQHQQQQQEFQQQQQQQQQHGHFAPEKNGQQQFHPQQGQQGQPANTYLAATPLASVQSSPAVVDCPACGRREVTRTEYVSGGTAHGSALLLCFCFCLGCIPYLASWFKDVEHRCGQCNVHLATWHRSGRTEVLALRSG